MQPHELRYADMATSMGMDPAAEQHVPFNIVNKTFALQYHRNMLQPIEEDGIDFWWLDWQQGEVIIICMSV